MVDLDVRTRREAEAENAAITESATPTPPRIAPRRRLRIFPLLIILAAVAVAVVLGRAMWDAYMGAPWTCDGTVRVYIVTMAPEVAGRIVELPVKDKQFVHKGDLLMVIDPTDYKIAVSLNEAAVQ
jgi:multidrug resistance efflux pump